jgi:hypothetical protein
VRSNCLLFALSAYWRWRKKGAYLCVRPSRHIAGWHWMVHYRGRFVHFSPDEPQPQWWIAVIHKLWFSGRIRRSD